MSVWKTVAGSVAATAYARQMEKKYLGLQQSGATQVDGQSLVLAMQADLLKGAQAMQVQWPEATNAVYQEIHRQRDFTQQVNRIAHRNPNNNLNPPAKSLAEFDQRTSELVETYRKVPVGAQVVIAEQREWLVKLGMPETTQGLPTQTPSPEQAQTMPENGEYLIDPDAQVEPTQEMPVNEEYLIDLDAQKAPGAEGEYLIQGDQLNAEPPKEQTLSDAYTGAATVGSVPNMQPVAKEEYLIQPEDSNSISDVERLEQEVSQDQEIDQTHEDSLGQLMLLSQTEYVEISHEQNNPAHDLPAADHEHEREL